MVVKSRVCFGKEAEAGMQVEGADMQMRFHKMLCRFQVAPMHPGKEKLTVASFPPLKIQKSSCYMSVLRRNTQLAW